MKLSATLVTTYKMCRRRYELRYIEELVPANKAEALGVGSQYHAMIENWYNTGEFNVDYDNPRISAMASVYIDKLCSGELSRENVLYAEKWFEYGLTPNHSIVGKNDAITKDGIPIEHKTTSNDVDDEYLYTLQWDEQILTYMLANGINEMLYTVIKKPTIRQKQNESNEEYYNRCVAWYEENTDKKVRVIRVTRSKGEIEQHRQNLIVLANEISNCKHYYRNPSACNCYNRRCEYASVCLNYNPHLEYVEFVRKERYTEEQERNELF